MTEHTEPHRWTLPPSQACRDAIFGPYFDTPVRVREDTATEADFEAILPLIQREDIYAPDEQARAILAAIFKEGGEGS